MAENNALATVGTENDSMVWDTILKKSATLVKSGLLPDTIRTPEACAAIILKGHELRLPAMYSLSNIVVIKGKPTCSAELMLALLYRDHGDNAIRIVETSAEKCVVEYQRRGWKSPSTYAFTIKEAQAAGLTTDTWKRYPAAMLRARCISAVARMGFPDSIGGMYSHEELGASVRVENDVVVYDGEVIDHDTGEIVPPQAEAVPDPNGPMGERTRKALFARAAESLDWKHPELHDFICDVYGVGSINDLPEAKAKSLTESFKSPANLERARKRLDAIRAAQRPSDEPQDVEFRDVSPDRQADIDDFNSRHPVTNPMFAS